jgi:hypothetical protein
MANEITLTQQLTVANGTLRRTFAPARQQITQASALVAGGVQNIGTTYEAVSLGAIAANGVSHFTNLDATNYVEIGVEVSSAFYPLVRLNAGESYTFRLAQGVTIFARANTAAVNLDYEIFNN